MYHHLPPVPGAPGHGRQWGEGQEAGQERKESKMEGPRQGGPLKTRPRVSGDLMAALFPYRVGLRLGQDKPTGLGVSRNRRLWTWEVCPQEHPNKTFSGCLPCQLMVYLWGSFCPPVCPEHGWLLSMAPLHPRPARLLLQSHQHS